MSSAQRFGSLGHLAGRFFGSIFPHGPSKTARTWAHGYLLPAEIELFEAMSGPDRRHAIGVAGRAIRLLEDSDGQPAATATRAFVAAALLHDVGKTAARLGTIGRVAATVASVTVGRDTVVAWAGSSVEAEPGGEPGGGAEPAREPGGAAGSALPARGSRTSSLGLRARMGCYLVHDSLGARQLARAGSDVLTVTWAREHHLPERRWSVEPRVGHALKEADGD